MLRYRRLFGISMKNAPGSAGSSQLTKTADDFTQMVSEIKTIQELRAISSGATDPEEDQELGYIHMGDSRLAEVDPNVSTIIYSGVRLIGNSDEKSPNRKLLKYVLRLIGN